jgi:HNH endonuclease
MSITSSFYSAAGQSLLRAVEEKTCGLCGYCGRAPGRHYSIDHIIPQVDGGTHDLTNLMVACRKCNTSKNRNSLEEYRLKIAIKKHSEDNNTTPFTPDQIEWLVCGGVSIFELEWFFFEWWSIRLEIGIAAIFHAELSEQPRLRKILKAELMERFAFGKGLLPKKIEV